MGTSITRRLTRAFVLVMGVLLLASGAAVYLGVRFSLDRSIERQLRSQATELARLVQRSELDRTGSTLLADRADTYEELLEVDGRVVAASPPLAKRSLLDARQLERARSGVHGFDRGSITHPGRATYRIHTEVVRDAAHRRLIAVVAVRRSSRDEALRELAAQLGIAGAVTLALTALVGYRLTRSALEPVEQMREQASSLYGHGVGQRLDVPGGDDELTRLATTLNELLARVDRTIERERAFAADASHELRTPLTLLKLEVDLALSRQRDAASLTDTLESVQVQSDRLVRLADDLLLVAGEQRDMEAVTVAVPLADSVDEALQRVGAMLDAGRSISVEMTAGLSVLASPRLLDRVLDNLLLNAIRHGGGDVVVRATAAGDRAELHILDAGSGFPDAFAARAFDRFAQDQAGRNPGGSGLGLAIVREIALAHGWSFGARNRPEGGADVWIGGLRVAE